MANIKPILYAVGGFALVYGGGVLYRQFSLIKNSDYKMKNVKWKGLDIRGAHLTAEMEMVNKSNINIETYEQDYDIYVNGDFVGKITDKTITTIPANGSGTFKFNIDIDPSKGLKAGFNVLNLANKGGLADTKIRIKGTMKAKTSGILFSRLPIDLEFRLGDYMN